MKELDDSEIFPRGATLQEIRNLAKNAKIVGSATTLVLI